VTDTPELADPRRDYEARPFDIDDTDPDPFVQFARWFAEVADASELEPNAAVLATATSTGRPSARHVLVKGVDVRGFTVFTNHGSRKARQLDTNPWASLTFTWAPLARQVLVDGAVERVTDAEADDYFASRPRGSQLGAWASEQSTVLADRAALDARYTEAEARFAGRPVERPPFWGGYRIVPDRIEFWQGRPSRLHDRIVYRPDAAAPGGWQRERLAP
jgi:pyridoxamine 5'-phosphate oxidase